MRNEPKIFDRYLDILEVKRSEPSLELLREIVKSHLAKIPFENISKLIFRKQNFTDIPTIEQYLEGIEKNKFGGTCYTLNYYLCLLLKHLGFNIKLCGADMTKPDVHLISMVSFNEKEFIVDCGYAAPFLEPLPCFLISDHIINYADERYILKPRDEQGRSKIEQYYKDELKHFYIAKPEARVQSDFYNVIKDSYSSKAQFMNSLLITLFSEQYSVSLRNLKLTIIKDKETEQKNILKSEIPEIVNSYFGMPKDLVDYAISDLVL